MTEPRRYSRVIETAYGCAGLILIGWSALHVPRVWYATSLLLLATVAVLTPYSFPASDRIWLPAAMPIEVMTMLIAPPPVSILVAGAMGFFTSLHYRRPPLRVMFNAANLAIPNALGATVLALVIRPWPQPLGTGWNVPVAVLAVLVRVITNGAGNDLIHYLKGKPRYWTLLRNTIVDEWRSGGFGMRLLPLLMALAYPTVGLWVLLVGGALQAAIGRSLQRYQEAISRSTLVDGLTGTGNRKAWEQYRTSLCTDSPHVLGIIDVDGLKATNDSYGHEAGDALLIDLVHRVGGALDEGRLFRLGGDEFLIVLPGGAETTKTLETVDAALKSFDQNQRKNGSAASASVGYAAYPKEAPDVVAALSLADKRMYQMKVGGNRSPR